VLSGGKGAVAAGADPLWEGLRPALLKANPEFRPAAFSAETVVGKRSPLPDPPLVGAAGGRLWEVTFLRSTLLAPRSLLNVLTAIRWDSPERLAQFETPWLYLGGRPRIFSRLSPDLDRILERQRRADRNLVGYRTGDRAFDRRWAFYAYRSRPAEVVRVPRRRAWLEDLATLRPGRWDEMPTIASLGTTASLGLVVGESAGTVRQAAALIRSFGDLLDAIELSTGNHPASEVPLTMDLLPDGSGFPSPTLRLRCPHCGQETHPRFVPDFHTERCAACRRGLYSS
jgi:hypothetical protein